MAAPRWVPAKLFLVGLQHLPGVCPIGRRMSERKPPNGVPSKQFRPSASPKADLEEVMEDFSGAFVFIETVINALDADSDRAFPELPVLQHGMQALDAAYDKLDLITSKLQHSQ